uniref:BEN domain-containing protein n=1 Tax=Knipowitschia caucasica TaxID=637954 RepID=A0AAV2M7X0_KNICA
MQECSVPDCKHFKTRYRGACEETDTAVYSRGRDTGAGSMPPKRDAGGPSTSPPVKMIKIGPDGQECDESRYRLTEEGSYSPYVNNEENEQIFDEDNIASTGLRTDTISLLLKIEQLQAQLKYERRCRILAERELRELKEMNTLMMQMRHTAHELRVTLDHVLQTNEPSAQDESMSYMSEPDSDTRASHMQPEVHSVAPVHTVPTVQNIQEDDENYLYLAENIRVPKNLYERIAEIEDYKKYTGALLMMLFDRDTLATHSLQGRRGTLSGADDSQKPQLPPDILRNTIEHISSKFGVDHGLIKTAIRTNGQCGVRSPRSASDIKAALQRQPSIKE